jgi:hypothetical protein
MAAMADDDVSDVSMSEDEAVEEKEVEPEVSAQP